VERFSEDVPIGDERVGKDGLNSVRFKERLLPRGWKGRVKGERRAHGAVGRPVASGRDMRASVPGRAAPFVAPVALRASLFVVEPLQGAGVPVLAGPVRDAAVMGLSPSMAAGTDDRVRQRRKRRGEHGEDYEQGEYFLHRRHCDRVSAQNRLSTENNNISRPKYKGGRRGVSPPPPGRLIQRARHDGRGCNSRRKVVKSPR